MTSKPLSDDEASKEMKKMVAFIMQEAAEKCREIEIKSDEEFNIEKAKLVRNETAAIETHYQKKLKQADVKRRIAQSIQINKSRLQVLQARDQILDEVLEETKRHLVEISSDQARYSKLLEQLILQGLFKLMDEKTSIVCRKKDREIVEKSLGQAISEFTKQTGIQLSPPNFQTDLPDECAGGVILSSLNGRIKCDNTLEMRMEHSFEDLLPKLRTELFGQSSNRKFFD